MNDEIDLQLLYMKKTGELHQAFKTRTQEGVARYLEENMTNAGVADLWRERRFYISAVSKTQHHPEFINFASDVEKQASEALNKRMNVTASGTLATISLGSAAYNAEDLALNKNGDGLSIGGTTALLSLGVIAGYLMKMGRDYHKEAKQAEKDLEAISYRDYPKAPPTPD